LSFLKQIGMLLHMSKHVTVHLSAAQRAELDALIRSGSCLARTQTKARILLLTDRSQGQVRTDAEIAAVLGVSKPTIIRTRRRFVLEGLAAALYDKPRPGAKPKITGEVEAQLTLLACSTPPEGKARWTLQLLADKLIELKLVESISDVAVMHRLKKTNSSLGG
jgi:transposase